MPKAMKFGMGLKLFGLDVAWQAGKMTGYNICWACHLIQIGHFTNDSKIFS